MVNMLCLYTSIRGKILAAPRKLSEGVHLSVTPHGSLSFRLHHRAGVISSV